MNYNIEFLVATYFISLFVDWCFQFDWQASNKSKWGKNDNRWISFKALITHSIIYGVFTICIASCFITSLEFCSFKWLMAVIVLTVSHMIIDTRIPVKYIMKWKGMTDAQINDIANYGFMHIGIDHRLHEMVLLILSVFM